MSVIPCNKNAELTAVVRAYADALMTEAHKLGNHGLTEDEFYDFGVLRGAIERVRGQYSATMRDKREFLRSILNYMQDQKFIKDWESAGEANRHDYIVRMMSGRVCAIESKGCLDGNNSNIYERPHNADEFVIWSVCTNAAGDPRANVWSGIHTRLSAQIISTRTPVDGLIVWDMLCGTKGRICPKLANNSNRVTSIAQHRLPPPCIYVFPSTVPSPRTNPNAVAQELGNVQFLAALHECFAGREEEVSYVDWSVQHKGSDTVRKTTIRRAEHIVRESKFTAIRRV